MDEGPSNKKLESHGVMLGVSISVVILLMSFSLRLPQTIANPENQTAYQQEKHEGAKTIPGIIGGWIHDNRDDINAMATVSVAFFTLTLWRATVKLWKSGERQIKVAGDAATEAARAANIAEKGLVVAQRPWVSVDMRIDGDLTYDAAGNATLPLRFILKNIGQSPAMNVHVRPLVFLRSPLNPDPRAEYQKMCNMVRLAPIALPMGYVVFPGETIDPSQSQMISVAEIQASLAAWPGGGTTIIWPHIVGCVSYRTALDDEQHQTGFMRQLLVKNPDPANRMNLGIDTATRDVTVARMILAHSILGSPSID